MVGLDGPELGPSGTARVQAKAGRVTKVLIIDDDPDICTLLERMLEPAGYATATANDGEAGLEAALDEETELVILDVWLPKIGAMIEVPSAVYQIEDICKMVDFVSIGTNDLTQYLLAVDRNNENVADLFSSLHPAVLKAMCQIVEGAAVSDTPVAVCGELAGDPLGVMALLGMGIDTLSMSVGSLLRAKKVIMSFSHAELTEMLQQALSMSDALMIREMYASKLDERGLGGLIRAGK